MFRVAGSITPLSGRLRLLASRLASAKRRFRDSTSRASTMGARTLHRRRYSPRRPAPPHHCCWRRIVVAPVVGCASAHMPHGNGAGSATVGADVCFEAAAADTGWRRPVAARTTNCNSYIAASGPLQRPTVDTGDTTIQKVHQPGRCLFGKAGRCRLASWGYRVTSKADVAIVLLPRLDTMLFHRRLIEVSRFSALDNGIDLQVNPRP